MNADRHYIGGGNVAGILGVSPYKSPLDEYLVIQSGAPPTSPQRQAFFNRRKALEPFAAEVFEQVTGRAIIARNVRHRDNEHEFMAAEIDFQVDDGGNGETKTVHPFAATEWGDSGSTEIPVYVEAQVQHGMGVNGAAHAWVHALVGLDDDRIYRIERDDDLIVGMRVRLADWWNDHVIANVPPPPMTIEDLRSLYPRDSGRSIEADEAIADLVARLKAAKAQAKDGETQSEELALQLKLYLRDATTLTHGRATLATWKAQTALRFNQAAFAAEHPALLELYKTESTTRVLRVK